MRKGKHEQKCLICGFSPAGPHYQTICCRACAAFFKRTYSSNHQDSYVCHKGGKCDVTDKMRCSCRYCRLKKCYAVGMVWNEKSDCPSTSSQSQKELIIVDNQVSELENEGVRLENAQPADNVYTYENIFGDYDRFLMEFRGMLTEILLRKPKPDTSNGLGICHQTREFYKKISAEWLNGGDRKAKDHGSVTFSDLICNHHNMFEICANVCVEFQQFCELPMDQRHIIFLQFSMRFPQMFRIFVSVQSLGHDINDKRMVAKHGVIFDLTASDMNIGADAYCTGEQMRSAMVKTIKTADRIFVKPFKRLCADDFEVAYLIVSAMWSLEGVAGITPETIKVVREIKERIADELAYHYKHVKKIENYAARIYKLHNIVGAQDKLADLRTKDRQMFNTFNMYKIKLKINELVINE